MRALFDFFKGIATGVAGATGRASGCLSLRTKKSGTKATNSAHSNWLEGLGRFILLALCIWLVAIAFFAAAGFPVIKAHTPAKPPIKLPPPPISQRMDEILAIDPAAPPREWKYIVIHHSATQRGSAASFHEAHIVVKGWRSLGYDFVIGNGTDQGDGVIAPGPRWYSQEWGAHANSTEYNEHGIGICLVGNFEEQPPTAAQWAALKNLCDNLCKRYDIPRNHIVGHNQIRLGGSTACPGRFLPLERLRE